MTQHETSKYLLNIDSFIFLAVFEGSRINEHGEREKSPQIYEIVSKLKHYVRKIYIFSLYILMLNQSLQMV